MVKKINKNVANHKKIKKKNSGGSVVSNAIKTLKMVHIKKKILKKKKLGSATKLSNSRP